VGPKINERIPVVDLVLIEKDPIPVRIHVKVGVGYFYIAKLDRELLPSHMRWGHLTLFNGN